jgi:hypothetical protein
MHRSFIESCLWIFGKRALQLFILPLGKSKRTLVGEIVTVFFDDRYSSSVLGLEEVGMLLSRQKSEVAGVALPAALRLSSGRCLATC